MSMADRDGFIWFDGKMVDWRDAKIHVLTHSLHYGMGVFQGVRAWLGSLRYTGSLMRIPAPPPIRKTKFTPSPMTSKRRSDSGPSSPAATLATCTLVPGRSGMPRALPSVSIRW